MPVTNRAVAGTAGTAADVAPVKFEPSNFTPDQLRKLIPPHCFDRSLIRSTLYLIRDLLMIAAIFYAATFIPLAPLWARYILWPVYWFIQGLVATGVWVIGHECGHQGYCDYRFINYGLGWVLHSALMVPFHSWRITHAQHHAYTNDLDRDHVHVPSTESEVGYRTSVRELIWDSPIYALFLVVRMSLLGWPAYLFANVSGTPRIDARKKGAHYNHFMPSSELFEPRQYWDIVWSDVGLILMLGVLSYAVYRFGAWAVVAHYFIPYLWVNFWLVTYTFLQHSHPDVPHYRGKEFTFVRGALATIDRVHPFLDFFHHDIGSGHVLHHLVSTMPHYHLREATEAVRPHLGKHYKRDDTEFFTALFSTVLRCYCVPDKGDIVFWSR